MTKNKVILAAAVLLVAAGLVLAFLMFRPGPANGGASQGDGSGQGGVVTDPQMLMIPRWFLRQLTVDGKAFELPEQGMTLQFEEGGKANGQGGCNGFGTEYEAGRDGKMSFGPVTSTMMACDQGMDREQAYLSGLGKVERYEVEVGKLTLSSADGKTVLVFGMPPK